jgi:hypothetical protein
MMLILHLAFSRHSAISRAFLHSLKGSNNIYRKVHPFNGQLQSTQDAKIKSGPNLIKVQTRMEANLTCRSLMACIWLMDAPDAEQFIRCEYQKGWTLS